jgi:hypothetical protein
MMFNMEFAFFLSLTMLSPLILAVLPGIGTTKSAFHAQSNGLSMLTKSAFPFLINAPLTEITELAFHASKDTILRTVPAFSPHSTTLSPPIPDVLPGIGTTKSVYHALNTGLSTLIKSAFQFLTNAPLTEMMELVFPASRDTILRTVPASSLHSTTLSLLILDVLPGIGTTKSALFAH